MKQVFIEEETFDKIDFTQTPLNQGDYEYCTFLNCNLAYANLSDIKFSACRFIGCNLSLVKLIQTALKDVKFTNCKMLGMNFGSCNEFEFIVSFDTCILDRSSFVSTAASLKKRVRLRQTIFKNSQLREVDFTNCDLSSAVFEECDLTEAIFKDTMLEKADFRTAFNYSIDPELNRIKKAKFSRSGIAGLLDKYDIEIDMTT